MSKVYAGDVGTDIVLDCGTSISSATVFKILFRRPDGATGEWIASPVTGQPNQLHYVVQLGDLAISGVWQLQAYVAMPGWSGRGEAVGLRIYNAFDS